MEPARPTATFGGINLYSAAPAALATFYGEVLDQETTGGPTYYELATPEATLGIVDAALSGIDTSGADRSAAELTIEVVDVDAEHDRLAHLAGWLSEPRWFDWGRVARLKDPDGNVIALQERSPATATWAIRDWESRTAEQLGWHLREAWWWMRRVLDGLTDEEYFWEPVPDCWTVRRQDTGWTVDRDVPTPDPPPFTTIAWRLAHVHNDVDGFGRIVFPSAPPSETGPASHADDALRQLRAAILHLRKGLASADDHDMRREVHAGGAYSVWSTITHALIEATHHTAEIGVIRDLFRHHHA